MTHQRALFKIAEDRIPGGVNSPVRAFKGVGGVPRFMRKGKGSRVWDEDGKSYLDFCLSWGPLLFGHAPGGLVRAVARTLKDGTSFGTATRAEITLAGLIRRAFPSMEKIRLVSSGTEAVMSAVRLARGFTGRKIIIKVDGGYHGHADSLLVKAGSGGATFGIPDSAGVPEALARLTVSIPFNDPPALEKIFRREKRNIAALILEPVPANMGVVLPRPGYLALARKLTRLHGSLLIFDEVITGFRLSPGGAQGLFGVRPDLTVLGKILGGGFPLAAFGGTKQIMDCLAPAGPVYQAGTLSGNPVAVGASMWMLEKILKTRVIKSLNEKSESFFCALEKNIARYRWPVCLNRTASMFTLFFTAGPVTDYESAKKSDTARFSAFYHRALDSGIYLSPSQFEANFISSAHTAKDLARALDVFCRSLKILYA